MAARREVTAHIMGPHEPHPVAVSLPRVRYVWREPVVYQTVVVLSDGGVWGLPDRALEHIDPGDVHANIAEIFARYPTRFNFITRDTRCRRGA